MKNPGLWARFEAPGPVARAWLKSTSSMTFIQGPVGSAKTTTGAMKCLETARLQHPSTMDGVRKALGIAIRMNYRQMHRSLITSWHKVFPPHMGKWVGEKDGPCSHDLAFDFGEGIGHVQLRMLFLSIGDNDIESFIRGLEPTFFWLNEVDELPAGSLGMLYGRAGRAYLDEKPDPDVVPPVQYSRIFGDLNAPDFDNWFNTDYLLKRPEGFEFHLQPSGFSPDAENLKNLRRDDPNYYENKARQMRADQGEWAVRRFIENISGFSRKGQPVYTAFGERHIVDDCTLDPDARLVIGVDQGLTPAAAFTQTTRRGALQIFDELVTDQGVAEDAEAFGRKVGYVLLNRYRRWCREDGFKVIADPASKQRDSKLFHFLFYFSKGLREAVGLAPVTVARSNKISVRLGWVNRPLGRMRDGDPEVRISRKRCPVLIRGFMGGYRMEQQLGRDGTYRPEPGKGPYSHPHDALQYGASEHELEIEEGALNEPFRAIGAGGIERWSGEHPTILLDH